MKNLAIAHLNSIAGIAVELNGVVSHALLRNAAEKLVTKGLPRDIVEIALFRVENLYNVAA